VKGITTDAIYDRQYWEAVRGRSAGSCRLRGVNGAVNSGPARSIMWLQQALRPGYTGRINGVMGIGRLAR